MVTIAVDTTDWPGRCLRCGLMALLFHLDGTAGPWLCEPCFEALYISVQGGKK